MEKQSKKAWLYLLPAMAFLGVFMIYPLIDVFVYSFEEGYNSASQTFFGVGLYNYSYVGDEKQQFSAITIEINKNLVYVSSVGITL